MFGRVGIGMMSAALMAGLAGVASANSVTFTGNAGSGRTATATFSIDTTTAGAPYLKIQLVNTESSTVANPTGLLTVIDFNTLSTQNLTTSGATKSWAVASGVDGTVPTFDGTTPFNGKFDAGTEWGIQNVSGSKSWALGSTGIGGMGLGTATLFDSTSSTTTSSGGNSSGATMQGLGSPIGGLTPASGFTGGAIKTPVFNGEIDFYISGISPTFDVSTINGVTFLYGTSGGEGQSAGTQTVTTPLPDAAWSGMAMLAMLGIVGPARKKLLR